MDVTAYFKFKERGGILRYSQGGSLKRGGQQNCFSSIRKESDKMGQNEYDFRNHRVKTAPETCVYFPDTIWPLKMAVSVIGVDFIRSLWGEQKYEPVYILNHDLSNSIEIWIVYKFTCRCEADYADRNSIHFETRESQNVSPGIHNGRFQRLEPPDSILFESLQRFCTNEEIKRKEEGKVFWMQYSVYLPLPDAWRTQRGRKKSFFSECNPLPIFLF